MKELNELGMYSTDDFDGERWEHFDLRCFRSEDMQMIEMSVISDAHANVEYCFESTVYEGKTVKNSVQFVADYDREVWDRLLEEKIDEEMLELDL